MHYLRNIEIKIKTKINKHEDSQKYCFAYHLTDAGPFKAIYNFGLEIAEDEPFTTPVTLIDSNG